MLLCYVYNLNVVETLILSTTAIFYLLLYRSTICKIFLVVLTFFYVCYILCVSMCIIWMTDDINILYFLFVKDFR